MSFPFALIVVGLTNLVNLIWFRTRPTLCVGCFDLVLNQTNCCYPRTHPTPGPFCPISPAGLSHNHLVWISHNHLLVRPTMGPVSTCQPHQACPSSPQPTPPWTPCSPWTPSPPCSRPSSPQPPVAPIKAPMGGSVPVTGVAVHQFSTLEPFLPSFLELPSPPIS